MKPKTDMNRFRRKAERSNKIARIIISLGGYGIIISIVSILLFLVFESLPLSYRASVKQFFSIDAGEKGGKVLLTGIDQYREVAYLLNQAGEVRFYRISPEKLLLRDTLPLQPGEKILSASKGRLGKELFAVGTNLGRVITGKIRMQPVYEGDRRRVVPKLIVDEQAVFESPADSLPAHIEALVYRKNEDGIQFWCWRNHQSQYILKIYDPDMEETYRYDLTRDLANVRITRFTLDDAGEKLIMGSDSGELFWFDLSDVEDVKLFDNWRASDYPITALHFLLGNSTLIVGDQGGQVEAWFPVRQAGGEFRFMPVHSFKPHQAPVDHIYASPRNRAFLSVDQKGGLHLNYSTTGKTELSFKNSPNGIQAGAIAPKSNGIILVDNRENMGIFTLQDPHPEATLKSLFGKVWYEGYPKPEFVWQSTGGSDEFEPKLSLIPLIFGTLKGTLYALIFSIPLAILAAIYVSQFSPRWLARVVKPTVEIMAALPSVVIGFLAGLYFSPLFERNLMMVFLLMILMPVVFGLTVLAWRLVPEHRRMKVPLGWELVLIIPVVVLVFWLAARLAHPMETWLFAGSLKQWMYSTLHITYDQRNSLVVGFALGFAVVPIIFTIAEDALSNVPESLTSASLALGASRWQTVFRIVLPAAAGGIFAAVMLGLGRAIGETMIVLMATGNTPLMDLSPFNGFRAMSACIAVEIPEAPVGGTLYRVLFLTALLLFLFTFVINTISALIGDRLRKKYARF